MKSRELGIIEGRQKAKHVEGARYPAVTFRSRENAGREAVPVRSLKRHRKLWDPSPAAAVARLGDDPADDRKPVVLSTYGPAGTLNKGVTNAADMSGAEAEGGVLLMSFNWGIDVSVDDGASWKQLDPTTVFPAVAGFPGFCCDQVVTYVPKIDRFVWFMQHDSDAAGQGAFRIAVASSGSVRNDPTAWTYWDFLAGDLGFPTTDMDYPDLSFSDVNLYVATDMLGTANGRVVVRFPLADLAAGGTLSYGYTDPTRAKNAMFSHLAQQSTDQAIWFGHRNNSTLEVYTMPDAGSTYSSFTVQMATWPNGTLTCVGPDGNDWLTKLQASMSFAVTGAVRRRNGNLLVAWTASDGQGSAQGQTFKRAHTRIVELDVANRTLVAQWQIWNDDYAFAYPSLAVNSKDEVGLLCGWGGPNDHANCAMGILGDFVLWFRDGSTKTVQRYGDYLTTRPSQNGGARFGAVGYWVTDDPADAARYTYHPFYARYERS
ncbi:hypothetical protein ACPPVS_01465 [Cellulomonas sp. McL0617]|uniref:hypothetical protein n=1 Tax=Cellulomonas sp. McL0617 TaxID=3415675 RepID=UPI003CEE5E7F